MRFLPRLLAGLLALAAVLPAAASELTIVRVLPEWRDASSFKRISEYFTGRENSGEIAIVRTHPEHRDGFYFLVRLMNAGTATPVKFHLTLITPTNAKPQVFNFDATLQPGKNLLNLGLTGEDWTDAKANPVAWKLDALAADGRVLASQKSYLWEQPTAN